MTTACLRKEILAMTAYSVADAEGYIKLDAMENPYGWPEDLQNLWLETLRHCPLNRYPDPEARRLTQTLRVHDGIPDTLPVLLGNGSDEIIQMLLMALPPGACVLSPTPGFVMYRQISQSLGLDYIGVALNASDFALDLPAMLAAIERHRPAIIFIAYPNNPTGNLFNAEALHQIIQAADGLVVIDEAYAPFANASFIDQLGRYPHLMVMRTVSKLGLAGLRLGYLTGHPTLIEQLNKIRLPYNINSLTQLSAAFALSHRTVFDQQTQAICAGRTWMLAQLNAIAGITAYPSAANFILFKTGMGLADRLYADLKRQGVLIKNLNPQGGLLQDCLRVTIGTDDENQTFIRALQNSATLF